MSANALIALLFIIGILLINFAMFAVVRGVARGDNRWLRAMGESLSQPLERSSKPYDELREQMQKLSGDEKRNEP